MLPTATATATAAALSMQRLHLHFCSVATASCHANAKGVSRGVCQWRSEGAEVHGLGLGLGLAWVHWRHINCKYDRRTCNTLATAAAASAASATAATSASASAVASFRFANNYCNAFCCFVPCTHFPILTRNGCACVCVCKGVLCGVVIPSANTPTLQPLATSCSVSFL